MSEQMQIGPRIIIRASCLGCAHERSEGYACQGDSGQDVSCAHPDFPAGRRIGDTTWSTPEWCPLYATELVRLVERLQAQAAVPVLEQLADGETATCAAIVAAIVGAVHGRIEDLPEDPV